MSEKLVTISHKAKSYVALYDRLIQPARPRWTDELLSAIWLDRVARNRRLARIRKVSGQVAEARGRAVETLRELLEIARELERSAAATNAMSIGRIARLENDVELARVQFEALRASCAHTLRALETHVGAPLPEDPAEWTRISAAFEGAAGADRVRHQRQWAAVLESIARIEGLREELRRADASFQRSSVIEQRVTGYLARLETESRLVDRRFDELEAEIRVGELEQILGTLDGKDGERPPLIDLREFEPADLGSLEEDAPRAV